MPFKLRTPAAARAYLADPANFWDNEELCYVCGESFDSLNVECGGKIFCTERCCDAYLRIERLAGKGGIHSEAKLRTARVGARVAFAEEKMAYTIQARSERYLICTKPFNARRTVLYTIVDLVGKIRGPDNLLFSNGYETREDCEKRLAELIDPETCVEISHRRRIPLKLGA
jgi:hypothetical protein